jgi:TonB family protein
VPRRIVPLLVLLAASPSVSAYEGAGIGREEAPPQPQAPPKLTKAPAIAHLVDAGWPPEAGAASAPVEVVLVIDIDATGHVTQAEVSRSGGPVFDAAAKQALLASTFTPAELDGKPGAVRIEFAYHFVPPPPPAPPPSAPAPKPINLKGRVLERGTRDPLPEAQVALVEPAQEAVTDRAGRFEFAGVSTGAVTIAVVAAGHQKFTTRVTIAEGKATEVTAYLWKSLDSPYESTVHGENQKTEVSQRTLEGDELTHIPGTFGDPLRALQALPGMARPSLISGALLVRGAQPQDSTVMFDGVPIPLLYHFGEGPSVINPSFIDRIDFFPGAYGVEYGRAIAGAVDVKTEPRAAARIHGKADINLLDSSFFLEGPAWDPKYGSWAIAARRSYVDLFVPLILKLGLRPGTASIAAAPVYWDFQARYDVSLGKHHFALVAFGSNDSLKVEEAGATNTPPIAFDLQQGFYRVGLKWTWTPRPDWHFSVAPTVGTTLNGSNNATTIGSNTISTDVSTSSLDWNLRASAIHDFTSRISAQLGIDGIRSSSGTTISATAPDTTSAVTTLATTTTISNALIQSLGSYVEGIFKPWDPVKIVPGLRVEEYGLPRGPTTSVEPRVNVRWDITPKWAVKAGWGLFSQAPLPGDLDPNRGNPNLTLEKSNQTAAGFEWRILPPLLLDVQGFFNLRSSLVVDTTTYSITNGQAVPLRKDNSGYGRTYGLEVLLKHEITKRLFGWIAYTLSRSEQWDPNTHSYLPISTDQTHILSAVASYHFTPEWEVGTRLQYTSGDPYTPVIGAIFNADTNAYAPIYGAPASRRLPYFFQLDLRAEHYWTFQEWSLSLYLDIQNVTDAPNPQVLLYDYRFQQTASINGLPILPYIGLTAGF